MFEEFSYAGYDQILGMLSAERANLCFGDFAGPAEPDRFFLLRHDVDYSLSAALKMAAHEAARGMRATYFLLLTCDHYNLLAGGACSIPRQLSELGHEVGLHYDVRAMEQRGGSDIGRQLRLEADLLAELTGRPVKSIAMHNPSVYGDDPFAGVDDFVNAYAPRFTREAAYYSDSAGAWRDEAFSALTSGRLPDRVQLLVHPFLWAETPGDRWERLDRWADEKREAIASLEKEIRELWSRHAGVEEHERRRKFHGKTVAVPESHAKGAPRGSADPAS